MGVLPSVHGAARKVPWLSRKIIHTDKYLPFLVLNEGFEGYFAQEVGFGVVHMVTVYAVTI
jgi:hypothetical protein